MYRLSTTEYRGRPLYRVCARCGRNDHKVAVFYAAKSDRPFGIEHHPISGYCTSCFGETYDRFVREVEAGTARIVYDRRGKVAKAKHPAPTKPVEVATVEVEPVLPAPARDPDLHAVFATDHAHKTYRVSDPLPWGDAQDVWANLDDLRRDGRVPHVKFYEVRSVTLGPDRPIVGPEVFSHDRYDRAPLNMMLRRKVVKSRGFKNVRDAARSAWRRFAPTFTVREGSWNATGSQGRGGWFYYPNGRTAAQGLGDLAGLCLRKNMVVQGGDGRWYVVD